MKLELVIEVVCILLSAALLYDLWRISYAGMFVKKVPLEATQSKSSPLLSILIPARNESKNIRRCLSLIMEQDYPAFEIIVVNDHSTDNTVAVVEELGRRFKTVDIKVVNSGPLPAGWFGKDYALHGAVPFAKGSWLLFLDADVEMIHPQCLSATMTTALNRRLDLFSMFERNKLESFWERVCLPIFLSLVHNFINFRKVADEKEKDGIASGTYLLFRKEAYHAIGGHTVVKDVVLEDFAFGKIVKASGLRLGYFNGGELTAVRQYVGLKHIWSGWTKNTIGLVGTSVRGYAASILYLYFTNLAPIFLALSCFSPHLTTSQILIRCAPLAIAMSSKIGLNLYFGVNPLYTLGTLTLGAALALLIHLNVIWDFLIKGAVKLNGRVYSRAKKTAALKTRTPQQKEETEIIRKNRWALVTGASAGIGREYCVQLAERGMNVVLVARRGAKLNELARELERRHGVQIFIVEQDLSETGAAASVRRRVIECGIKINLLVNNAAQGYWGPVDAASAELYEKLIHLNIGAGVALSLEFLPELVSQKPSGIINVSSQAAFQPMPHMAMYAATKAFVQSFSQALYQECKEKGVVVQTFVPGSTESEFDEKAGGRVPGVRRKTPAHAVGVSLSQLESGRPVVASVGGVFFQKLLANLFGPNNFGGGG